MESAKTQCSTCEKKTTFHCTGCSKNLCLNCLTKHVETLSTQLDEIEYGHDQFRQKLNDQKDDPNKHSLIQQINKWEKDSINKIKIKNERLKLILLYK